LQVRCLTCVLGEADGERGLLDLLLEQVLLVEEEDDGGVSEPLVVADGVKQLQALLHPVLRGQQYTTSIRLNLITTSIRLNLITTSIRLNLNHNIH
jgi:hypothetical protein